MAHSCSTRLLLALLAFSCSCLPAACQFQFPQSVDLPAAYTSCGHGYCMTILSVGAIIGIAIACLVVAAGIVVMMMYFAGVACFKKRGKIIYQQGGPMHGSGYATTDGSGYATTDGSGYATTDGSGYVA